METYFTLFEPESFCISNISYSQYDRMHDILNIIIIIIIIIIIPPHWSSGQHVWLLILRSRVRSPALPKILNVDKV